MTQSLPVDEVHVLSTYVESILYGVFFVMYLVCVWVLVKRRSPVRGINKTMLSTATAMMIIATLFEAVSIQRDVEAFFRHKDGTPVAYYDLSSNWANLYQSTLWSLQLLIGDSLLVYRMYVVYSRRLRVVVVPILLLIGSVVCGVNVIREFSLVDASNDPTFFTKDVAPWTTSVMAVTISQNVISTLAIALRLWWAGRNVGSWFGGRYWGSITVFLESGLPYTLTLTILTILHVRDQNVYDFAYYGIVPITGISFTGLLIRVGLRHHAEVTGTSGPSGLESTFPHKIRSHRLPGGMTFATPPTQTQGTVSSTMIDSTAQPAFASISTPNLEKAVLPIPSSHSGFSLSAASQTREGCRCERHLQMFEEPAKSEVLYH